MQGYTNSLIQKYKYRKVKQIDERWCIPRQPLTVLQVILKYKTGLSSKQHFNKPVRVQESEPQPISNARDLIVRVTLLHMVLRWYPVVPI